MTTKKPSQLFIPVFTKLTEQEFHIFSRLPKTRAHSSRLRLKFYDTRKPCAYGHMARRRTDNSYCEVCFNGLVDELKEGSPLLFNMLKEKYGDVSLFLAKNISYLEQQLGKNRSYHRKSKPVDKEESDA